MLELLQQLAADQRWPVIRLCPTSGELDGALNAIAQGAAGLIERGANGELERVFDPTVTFDDKLDAFGRSLGEAEDSLILIDMPDSWAHPRFGKDGGTFAFQGENVIREVLSQRNGHRVVLASRRALLGAGPVKTLKLPQGGGSMLAAFDWGRCQAAAVELGREVAAPELAKLTPLALRVAVALAALGLDPARLRNACRGGWPTLRSMLQSEAQRRRWLG